MGLFSCKNCTSVLYSVGVCLFFLCLSDLFQFLFIKKTIYFQKGELYRRPVFPTSIALITGVKKKVHISVAQ